ncbi:MAG: hypothetical protein HQL66_04495 [Magnetococcales bacterium]|nr:hypothetical protein [Magnetococcales bacterium]
MKKVTMKGIGADVEIKNKGIEFKVSNSGHVGDFYVTKRGIEWCPGKVQQSNGVRLTWEEVAKTMA